MLSSIGSRVAADPEELHFRREARSRFVRTFLRYPAAFPALILFVIVVLCALGAPLLTQYTPFEGNAAERLQGIGTAGHLLGTDEQGRDILTRCLYGGRLSLLMGFLPVALATIVGSILGIFSMRSPPFCWPSRCPRFWARACPASSFQSPSFWFRPSPGWPNPPCRISCRRTLLRRRRPPGPAR